MLDENSNWESMQVAVTVEYADQAFIGNAGGQLDSDKVALIAKAALAAANATCGQEAFFLDDAVMMKFGAGELAVVLVRADDGDMVSGSAPVRADGWEKAVCRAALDAVNRKVERFLFNEAEQAS